MRKAALIIVTAAAALIMITAACSVEEHTHKFDNWETVKSATCTEEGEKRAVCECGEEKTEIISAKGHTFGEWEKISEATADKDGEEVRRCNECGYEERRKIPFEGEETGEKVLITTESQLLEMVSGEKTGNYELGADITLTSVWKTAGEFKGTLDGKNHTVYNMEVSSDVFQPDGTSVNYMAAMFSENKGVIKNINFENFSVNISENSIKNAGYDDVINSMPVKAENLDIHVGITGLNKGEIENVKVDAYITIVPSTPLSRVRCGAVAGKNNGKITGCITTGSITVIQKDGYIRAGGIAGYMSDNAVISGCESAAEIKAENSNAKNNLGGIVGNIECGTVENCFYSGVIESSNSGKSTSAGGIAGLIDNLSGKYETMNITVSGCCSRARIKDGGIKGSTGGIIGEIESAVGENKVITLKDCSADSTAEGAKDQGGFLGDLKLYDQSNNKLSYPLGAEYAPFLVISGNECTQNDDFAEVKPSSQLRPFDIFQLA